MISFLVLISRLSDMVRTYIIDTNAKIDIIQIYRDKKLLFQDPRILGFPNQSLCYVIRGGIPWNYKGIPLSDNPMYAKLNYQEK